MLLAVAVALMAVALEGWAAAALVAMALMALMLQQRVLLIQEAVEAVDVLKVQVINLALLAGLA